MHPPECGGDHPEQAQLALNLLPPPVAAAENPGFWIGMPRIGMDELPDPRQQLAL